MDFTSHTKRRPCFVMAALWVRPAATCTTCVSGEGRGRRVGIIRPPPQQNTELIAKGLPAKPSAEKSNKTLNSLFDILKNIPINVSKHQMHRQNIRPKFQK